MRRRISIINLNLTLSFIDESCNALLQNCNKPRRTGGLLTCLKRHKQAVMMPFVLRV